MSSAPTTTPQDQAAVPAAAASQSKFAAEAIERSAEISITNAANEAGPAKKPKKEADFSAYPNFRDNILPVLQKVAGKDHKFSEDFARYLEQATLNEKLWKRKSEVELKFPNGNNILFGLDPNGKLSITKKAGSAFDQSTATVMIASAMEMGWKDINVTGSQMQMDQLWLEASKKGLTVKNYTPTPDNKIWELLSADRERREAMTKEIEAAKREKRSVDFGHLEEKPLPAAPAQKAPEAPLAAAPAAAAPLALKSTIFVPAPSSARPKVKIVDPTLEFIDVQLDKMDNKISPDRTALLEAREMIESGKVVMQQKDRISFCMTIEAGLGAEAAKRFLDNLVAEQKKPAAPIAAAPAAAAASSPVRSKMMTPPAAAQQPEGPKDGFISYLDERIALARTPHEAESLTEVKKKLATRDVFMDNTDKKSFTIMMDAHGYQAAVHEFKVIEKEQKTPVHEQDIESYLVNKKRFAATAPERQGLGKVQNLLSTGEIKIDDFEKKHLKELLEGNAAKGGGFNKAMDYVEDLAKARNRNIGQLPRLPETEGPKILVSAGYSSKRTP